MKKNKKCKHIYKLLYIPDKLAECIKCKKVVNKIIMRSEDWKYFYATNAPEE